MTMITPGEEDARTAELMLEVQDSLRDMRRAFKALKERVETGEDVKATDVKSKLSELNTVLVNCHKMETALADSRSRCSQIVGGGFAFNFELAEHQVRCALARVRSCCGAGEVSG